MTGFGHKVRHRGPLLTLSWKASLDVESRVVVGPGARDRLSDTLRQLGAGGKVLVVSQAGVLSDWLPGVVADLGAAGFAADQLVLPDGEEAKSVEALTALWKALADRRFARNDTLVAIGGGALSDVVGFAAATFKRGVNLVLVPTTLLAQVDAAIGGKTAINLDTVKNIVGTFYFPRAVLADPETLADLPARQFASGLAEIIKYALIEETVAGETEYTVGQRPLLDLIESCAGDSLDWTDPALVGIITASIKMKLAVVGIDPHESGLRRALNLGHTLGHAIESVSGYTYTHGEAISIGMIFALNLAAGRGLIDSPSIERVAALCVKAGLPVGRPRDLSADSLIQSMLQDKKRVGESLKFVLPATRLGVVDYSVAVPVEEISQYL